MTAPVTIRPGHVALAEWRAVYRGASIELDPVARADVEAGAAALAALPKSATDPSQPAEGPTVAEMIGKGGEALPRALARLFAALKLASLAQGASGVRWEIAQALESCLARDFLPAIPSGGASSAIGLSHLYGVLTGTGEVMSNGKRGSAARALKKARLAPAKPTVDERRALLSGTQLTTAKALAGLFEAERVLQSALVTAALSTAAIGGGALHPGVRRLYRHAGQFEIGAALGALRGAGGNGAGGESDFCRTTPLRMGACLDLLRQAGDTLERAANAVGEHRLVLWQTGEVATGVEDTSSVAFAADLIAMALRQIGDLSAERVAMLSGPGAPGADTDTGMPTPQTMAAGFASENGERGPSPAESLGGTGRLLKMAGTTALVLALEALAATRAAGVETGENASPLDAARRLIPRRSDARTNGVGAEALATAVEIVRSGALAEAPGIELPSVVTDRSKPAEFRLGDPAKRK